MAANAIDLIVGQLLRGEYGLPEEPKLVLSTGIWHEASSSLATTDPSRRSYPLTLARLDASVPAWTSRLDIGSMTPCMFLGLGAAPLGPQNLPSETIFSTRSFCGLSLQTGRRPEPTGSIVSVGARFSLFLLGAAPLGPRS